MFLHRLQDSVGFSLGDHGGDAKAGQRLGFRFACSQKHARLRGGPQGTQKRFGSNFWRVIADEDHVIRGVPRQFAGFDTVPGYGGVESAVFEDVLQMGEHIRIMIQNENFVWTLAHVKLLRLVYSEHEDLLLGFLLVYRHDAELSSTNSVQNVKRQHTSK